MSRIVRVATRGSGLALTQTRWVIAQLQATHPDVDFVINTYKTTGDATQAAGTPLSQAGGKGLFTKELEEALLDGRADLAVHSLKDVPTDLPAGLELGCIPPRAEPADAIITSDDKSLEELPPTTTVGTSSLRRIAQLRHYRPDLRFVPVRGNVDTRLRKLAEGQVGALVMAAAGLMRLGYGERARRVLPLEVCLPAAGQGALAVEVRSGDAAVATLLSALHHGPTATAITAERAFLATVTAAIPGRAGQVGTAGAAPALGSACQVPVAAFALLHQGHIQLRGLVALPDGTHVVAWAGEAPEHRPLALGQAVAEAVLARGGQEILTALHQD